MKISKLSKIFTAAVLVSSTLLQSSKILDVKADVDKSIYMDVSQQIECRVQSLLSQMTLEEKIRQTMQISSTGTEEAVKFTRDYAIGSVLAEGDDAPRQNNPAEWRAMISNFIDASLSTRLAIPIFYEMDAVHGNGKVFGSTIFPHNIGLGAAKNSNLMVDIGKATASEMRAIGCRGNFAPCLAAPQNIKWGRTYEGYSSDRSIVADLGSSYVAGLQGGRLEDYANSETFGCLKSPFAVFGTAKHFFGEDLTKEGVNQGDMVCADLPADLSACTPQMLLEKPIIIELLAPYEAVIKAGVRSLMPSYSSINGIKMHEQKALLDLIKLPESQGGLGFTGFVVTDYKACDQVRGSDAKEKFARCMNAGCDLFMLGQFWFSWDYLNTMKANIEDGTVSMDRLNDAVSRILRVKFEIGLFENPRPGDVPIEAVGCPEHRGLARQAVRESLVLLKNKNGIMGRLKNANKILVTGRFGDDIGSQCGGWTMCWQGKSGNIVPGTSFLQAVKKVKGDGNVGFERTGNRTGTCANPDVILASVGELPYAEGNGDEAAISPSRLWGDPRRLQLDRWEDMQSIQTAKQSYPGVPIVLVIFSGRPLIIESVINQVDGVVAAWWPGTEADGIADVLFGDFDFTGKLPLDWPLRFEDVDDKSKPVRFTRGYGLTKQQTE
ncbi:MAG: glycoside hydrolase family 3 C-terminal domain-containing protein [Oscillospiraceae bacterium]|nr:glycoside hydrolase family 3 C-terminal domain-containing protein [Oscillospiraceae bacterium]